MAVHNIARGDAAVHDVALVANTADTVNFPDDVAEIEVLSDGSAALYVDTSGSDATVGGARTFEIPAGAATSVRLPLNGTKVSLISSGTPTYTVQEADHALD